MAPFSQNGKSHIQEILETIGLADKANVPAGILAHGEKQWLELGMLMAQDPELLLVDEPVAGMSPRETERTGEPAHGHGPQAHPAGHRPRYDVRPPDRQQGDGTSRGRMLCQGTMKEVQNNPKVIEVYLGQHKEENSHTNGVAGGHVALAK